MPPIAAPGRRRLTGATTVAVTVAVALAAGVHPARALTSPGLVSQSPDSGVATADGRVSAFVQSGNVLYVGGQFHHIGGYARNGVAALDATSGQVIPGFTATVSGFTDGEPDGGVASLAIAPGGQLVVGGTFGSVNGVARSNLAKVSAATGELYTSWNPAPNNTVAAVAVAGGRVLVGGKFGVISGVRIARLAEVDVTSGAAYTGFAPNPNAPVRALHVNPGGGSVIVGGDFTSVVGLSRPHLALLSVGTGAAYAWRPNAALCPVYSIATDARPIRVFVGCGGGASGGNRVDAFYYSTGGSAWPGLGSAAAPARANGDVDAVAVLGDTVYAGGHFSTVNGTDQKKLAAFDAYTGELQTFNAGFEPAPGESVLGVLALLATAGRLWAGGDFTNPANRLARFTVRTPPAPSSPVPAAVAVQSTNGAAYVYRADTGTWVSYGGRVTGPPAVATAPSPYGLYLVASTPSGRLYSRTTTTGWTPAAASTNVCTGPDLTYAQGRLVLACTGGNRAVYTAEFDPARSGNPYFGTFTSLGGTAYAGPAVYRDAAGTLHFTAVGGTHDSTLATLYTRTGSTGFTAVNTRCASHPATGTRVGQLLYTGCRDSIDSTLHVTISVPGRSSAVFDGSLGGGLVGGVGVAVAGDDGAATFFAEGTSGAVYRNTVSSDGTASGWASIGGLVAGGVRATATS